MESEITVSGALDTGISAVRCSHLEPSNGYLEPQERLFGTQDEVFMKKIILFEKHYTLH